MDPRLTASMMEDGLTAQLAQNGRGRRFQRTGHQHPAAKPGGLGQFHQRRRSRLARHLRFHPSPSARAVQAVLLRPPKRCPARVLGRRRPSAATRFLAVQSQAARRPCCAGRGCRFGITSTRPASRPRSTTCRRTIRPARRSTAIIAASAAWARPTCWAPTARINTSAKMRPADGVEEGGGKRVEARRSKAKSAQARIVGPAK